MKNLHNIKPNTIIPAGYRAFAYEWSNVKYAWISAAQIMINTESDRQVNPQMEEIGGSALMRKHFQALPNDIPPNIIIK
jgi:hypothetical protein